MGVSRIVLLFIVAIMMAMFVVWERNKIIELGYQVARLQRNCAELSEKNRKLSYYVNRLKSPEMITYKIQSLKLPLVPQEEKSGIMILGEMRFKENMMKSAKAGMNQDLYTQKKPMLDCCSLHN